MLKEVPRVPALPYAPAGPPQQQFSGRLQSQGFNKTQEAIKKDRGASGPLLAAGPSRGRGAQAPARSPQRKEGGTGQQPPPASASLTGVDEPRWSGRHSRQLC